MNLPVRTALAAIAATMIIASASSVLLPSPATANTRYIAHRGLVDKTYPENTLEAFEKASQTDGVWGVETDIYRTADGKYVCMHGKEGVASWCGLPVSENPLEVLRRQLSFNDDGRGYRLPTLEEYLGTCKAGGKHAVVELKDKSFDAEESWSREVVDILEGAGMLENCILISFQHDSLGWAKDYAQGRYGVDIPCYALAATRISGLGEAVSSAKKMGLEGVSVPRQILPFAYPLSRLAGLELQAWTYRGRYREAADRDARLFSLDAVSGEYTPNPSA